MTDVVQFNRGSALARVTGACLVAAGILGVAAFVWYTVRSQQHLEYSPFSDDDEGDPSLLDRVDVFTTTVTYLMFAVLPVGVGVGLRMFGRSAGASGAPPVAPTLGDTATPA